MQVFFNWVWGSVFSLTIGLAYAGFWFLYPIICPPEKLDESELGEGREKEKQRKAREKALQKEARRKAEEVNWNIGFRVDKKWSVTDFLLVNERYSDEFSTYMI